MSNSRCSFVFWDKRVGFVGSKSSLDQIARVFLRLFLSFRYEKRKREREENIMRRSDGQSFQPLSVHFPSLPPSLFFPFFPSFSTISGIVLETRLIVSSNFSPPCTLSPRMMIPLRNIREYCTTQANCPDRLQLRNGLRDGWVEGKMKIAIEARHRSSNLRKTLRNRYFPRAHARVLPGEINCNPL